MSARYSSFTIVLLALFFLALPAKAQYVDSNEILTAGQPVTVSVPQADTLIVTYRPESNIAEVQKFAVSSEKYTWTPEEAGLVSLSTVGGLQQTVSVRFAGFPFQGLVVFIIAGGILFGGAIFASVKLFGKTSSEMVTDRPDT